MNIEVPYTYLLFLMLRKLANLINKNIFVCFVLIPISLMSNFDVSSTYRPCVFLLKISRSHFKAGSSNTLSPLHTNEFYYKSASVSERDTCTPMFITALFIIARIWKQPRIPSTDKWIRKLWYIYTMEYYSAIKKNSYESVLMGWMKLEPIIQSEVSQKDKDQYSILTHIYGI